ncbi:type II toxin-antitoxin system RelE/ParE family toxin [Candidatus Pacearchaeota archaeon]|nr:type II toxin-antitoxin system RelE/ParE family toxin [Candidatus Pacearchaeota archaeon]
MVNIKATQHFESRLTKLDNTVKIQIDKVITKIAQNPTLGKPMHYERKDTREVYVGSFRLAYTYEINIDTITFLEIYHKDEQ